MTSYEEFEVAQRLEDALLKKEYPGVEPERAREIIDSEPLSRRKYTLLRCIDMIVELTEDCKLNKKLLKYSEPYIKYVAKRLGISNDQALIFSVLVEKFDDFQVDFSDLAGHFNCSAVKMLQFENELEQLEKLRLIRCERNDRHVYYKMPSAVLNALKKNEAYVPVVYKDVDIETFFKAIDEIFTQLCNNETTWDFLSQDLMSIIDLNPNLYFVQKINQVKKQLDYTDIVILLFFCNRYVDQQDEKIPVDDFAELFDKERARKVKNTLNNESAPLFKFNIIEPCNNGGFTDGLTFRLTDMVKDDWLTEMPRRKKVQNFRRDLIKPQEINEKKMQYNATEKIQVERLEKIISESNFKQLVKRLEKKGLRSGFTCLFYGAPGTGKTETVLQMAKKTGRHIMQVNLSKLKSMWVGESEKNIKKCFDEYREMVGDHEIAPILLFNEADGIISRRKPGAEDAVDKMENTMQNIILQEMETLNGIMIATTNLTENMDKAFERRFLYKIKFDKPTPEIRASLWTEMIAGLDANFAKKLAEKYDFSGGQIENVARKTTISCILDGVEVPNNEIVVQFCDEETIDKQKSNVLGFANKI